jgi:hypothetical protein
MAPTHEDAQLMIQIAQWGTAMGLDAAREKLGEPRLYENFEALARASA